MIALAPLSAEVESLEKPAGFPSEQNRQLMATHASPSRVVLAIRPLTDCFRCRFVRARADRAAPASMAAEIPALLPTAPVRVSPRAVLGLLMG